MGKYEVSAAGISHFIKKLYAMDDSTLCREAETIARDPIAAVAGHFELQVYQLEYLRGLRADYVMMMGYSLAAAILARRPVILRDMRNAAEEDITESCIMTSSSLIIHLSANEVVCSGQMNIQLG